MKIKSGVSMVGLQIEVRKILVNAERVWKSHGQEVVVTEACGGVHSAGSLHYYGYAVDLRSRYFEPGVDKVVAGEMRALLPSDYDVVVHRTHIHVEYDPK